MAVLLSHRPCFCRGKSNHRKKRSRSIASFQLRGLRRDVGDNDPPYRSPDIDLTETHASHRHDNEFTGVRCHGCPLPPPGCGCHRLNGLACVDDLLEELSSCFPYSQPMCICNGQKEPLDVATMRVVHEIPPESMVENLLRHGSLYCLLVAPDAFVGKKDVTWPCGGVTEMLMVSGHRVMQKVDEFRRFGDSHHGMSYLRIQFFPLHKFYLYCSFTSV